MSKYRYSFSGSDVRVFAFYPGFEQNIVELESFNTLSASVHEAKSQARTLGRRTATGIAGAVRTIAGSFIMTVIEDHPLRLLTDSIRGNEFREPKQWSQWSLDRYNNGTGSSFNRLDFNNRLSTTLPEFNLLCIYVSEGAQFNRRLEDIKVDGDLQPTSMIKIDDIPGTAMMIEGISIIDEGIVTSIHDVVSEMSFSYLARNILPLSRNQLISKQITDPTDYELHLYDKEIQDILAPTDYVFKLSSSFENDIDEFYDLDNN